MLSERHRAWRSVLGGLWICGAVPLGCSLGLPVGPAPPDAGSADAGGDGPVVLSCPPNPTGFKPPDWHPPIGGKQGKCSEAQATQLAECAAADSFTGAAPCADFKANVANATCYACAVTSSLAFNYGALIDDGFLRPNIEGCFSIVSGDLSASSCGARVQANGACSGFSCRCPDEASFQACFTAAATGPCAAYDASCAETFEPQCYADQNKEWYLKVIRVFCGQ